MDRRRLIRTAVAAAGVGLAGRPVLASNLKLDLGTAVASVLVEPDADAALALLLRRWIEKSAQAVTVYYGKFPVPQATIRIRLGGGKGVRGGQTFPSDPPTIRVRAGRDSNENDLLLKDWVMVHEMVHLAFPWLDGEHNWMAEGIAVYVESIARVQAGHLPAEQIWSDFVKMMPRGLPETGEGGLDQTPSWGRTYWGGAMFCLEADVTIRRQTGNRYSLQHALRAINATRNFSRSWPFRETLEIGDRATGRSVLIDQYDAMRNDPVSPDLAALWRDLGIVETENSVSFDDKAPLAAIRLAITRPI